MRSKNGLGWRLEFTPRAEKSLEKLGAVDQQRVRKFLRFKVEHAPNPRSVGDPLSGDMAGYWRYRVGDIRILCRIEDEAVVIVVVEIGHRREIYRRSKS